MAPALLMLVLGITVVIGVAGVATWAAGSAARAEMEARSAVLADPGSSLRLRLDERLRRTPWGRTQAQRLAGAGVELRVVDLALLLAGGGIATVVVSNLVLPLWAALLLGAFGYRVAFDVLARLRMRRNDLFMGQLPELARVLSNASSAGLSIATGLATAAKELDAPAATELVKVREELRLGASMEQALTNLERRMPSRELGILVTTLVIQQRAGGDMVAALRELAITLETRRDLLREITTMMSGEVFTLYLVVGIGAGALLLLEAIEPGLVERMLGSLVGIIAVVAGVGLMLTGFLMARRITRVEA
jgi:tight adherence protein B